jgi:hypothetical protein
MKHSMNTSGGPEHHEPAPSPDTDWDVDRAAAKPWTPFGEHPETMCTGARSRWGQPHHFVRRSTDTREITTVACGASVNVVDSLSGWPLGCARFPTIHSPYYSYCSYIGLSAAAVGKASFGEVQM